MTDINKIVLGYEWKPPIIRCWSCLIDIGIYLLFISCQYFPCYISSVIQTAIIVVFGMRWFSFFVSNCLIMRCFGTQDFTSLYFEKWNSLLSWWAGYKYTKKFLLNIVCDIPMIWFLFHYGNMLFGYALTSFLFMECIYVKHFRAVTQDEINSYRS